MTVFFTGLGTSADRTLFTNRGPIVKKPIQLISGSNLLIVGPNQVSVPTRPFSYSYVGKQIIISGSLNGRNDGTFNISKIISTATVELENANFDWVDEQATLDSLILLSNELQDKYNKHRVSTFHVNPDIANPMSSGLVVDVDSAIILLNSLLTTFSLHIGTVFSIGGPVHIEPDAQNLPQFVKAHNFSSAILLANELRRKMELHRQNGIVHLSRDIDNRISAPEVIPVLGSGPLVGPFSWIIQDLRTGKIADEPEDVTVRVNSIPVQVDAVFGLLGAIVLTNKPVHGDTVTVDYSYLSNPPTIFERLNTPEFVLNGIGNNGIIGLPGHNYRARSHLINPESYYGTVGSAFQPRQTGWKYKALERAYTAVLNDPNTLLLNVPGNRVAYPVFETTVQETTVRYDPTTFPDQATDPWTSEGTGVTFLEPGGTQFNLTDDNVQSGPFSNPPFYSHSLNLGFPNTVSAAFRMSAEFIQNDGVMVGPGFGITNGFTLGLAGLLETTANNLSSSIARANTIMDEFNAHLITIGVHRPDSPQDSIDVVAATDEVSLIILTNRLKALFNQHIARGSGGDGVVHIIADVVNTIYEVDATDVASATSTLNIIADRFNFHRTEFGVHYVEDIVNIVGPVKQVGLLKVAQYPELETSWVSSAFDWTRTATYRLFKDSNGNISLYTGGDFNPLASIVASELPHASDVDLKIDPIQQVFFGSLSRQASSTSFWNFVRVNVTPLSFDQSIGNKSVVYEPIDIPEKDPFAPWIGIGNGGYDRIVSGKLIIDSTASVLAGTEDALGLSTGAYRGFLRLEPVLQRENTCSIEFTVSAGFYTYSVNNRASGVFLDDGGLSVHFVFIQATPTPPSITGVITEPFPIVTNDTAILSINGALPQTITFTFPVTDAVTVSNVINAQLPFPLASANSGRVTLTNQSIGSVSSIQVIGGHVFEKLGIPIGTYFGRDSNSEPKVSWFGGNYPDLEVAPWIPSGTQSSRLYGRTLRITDSSSIDYIAYSFTDPLYLSIIMASDWKFDFRCAVVSCVPGDPIFAGTNLKPCGVLINIDEGTSGKNVELHLAQDSIGQQYVNIVSYDSFSSALVSIGEFPFAWNDNKIHSYDIYTSKAANLCIVLADNTPIGTFAYSSLKASVAGPAITFGSGSEPAANADLRSPESIVDWSSVCIFRDSKISDPSAVSNRYVGLYKGGDSEVLSSYYLHQIDWTQTHTYRIVRDPISVVSVYVDGALIPSISINYDVLTLPPSSSSFLKEITNCSNAVAFGSFNPFEIDRMSFGIISYSIGRITLTDRRIPGHQVLNQGNVIASPEHLFTKLQHSQFGFSVWSGGTPSDDFISGEIQAHTVLGDGIPPVPMTQNLESRGGLVKIDTPTASIPSEDFVNAPGFVADLEDDTTNIITVIPFTKQLIDLVNNAVQKFNQHLTASIFSGISLVQVHLSPDTVNAIPNPPATDLASAISLLNILLSAYQAHRVQVLPGPASVHDMNDMINVPTAFPATDAQSAYVTATNLIEKMNDHFIVVPTVPAPSIHFIQDKSNIVSGTLQDPLYNARDFAINIKTKFNSHLTQRRVHLSNDPNSFVPLMDPPLSPPDPLVDMINGISTILASVKIAYNRHRTMTVNDSGSKVHTVHDIVNPITAPDYVSGDSFDVIVDLCYDEWIKYSAHLINQGSHGSSVFIRLDPPNRVLYESMKFFTQVDGEPGLLSPFSDDETLHLDGITATDPHSVGISGRAFPEQAQLVGASYEPFTILGNGLLILNVDGVQTDIQLHPTDTTVALVITKINSFFPGPVCFEVGDGRLTVVSPTSGQNSFISASGPGAASIGLEVPGMTPWILSNGDNPGVSISLVAAGPVTALRYASNTAETAYRTATGLPDSPSLNFEVAFSIRIQQWILDAAGDTGIYAGISGAAHHGFTIGVGFEEISGLRWVKLQNLAAANASLGIPYGKTVYRIPFDWGDGNFHEYKIVRDAALDSVSLVIVS